MVDETISQSNIFYSGLKKNMLQYPCVHRNLQKYEEVVSEIFKGTRSGKPDAGEALYIEGCVKPNLQEK